MALSSTLRQTKQNLDASGVGYRAFAKLSGMPLSTLHAVLDGKFSLRPGRENKLLALSNRCFEMSQSLRPLKFLGGDTGPLEALVLSNKTPEQIREFVNAIFQ
jgi:hypothetical protein